MQQQNQQNGELCSQVIAELSDWAAITGRPLPMPAAEIARIEASGRVVDLVTGKIVNPKVYLQTSIEIAGDDAGLVASGLWTMIDAGALDLAIVHMVRAELRGVTGDWRIVRCESSAAEVYP